MESQQIVTPEGRLDAAATRLELLADFVGLILGADTDDPLGTPQPLTRDVRATMQAIEVVIAELLFQSARIKNGGARARTGQENEYLARMARKYEVAAYTLRTLLRYHEGSVRRRRRGPDRESATVTDDPASIDASGRAVAHVGDEALTGTDLINEVG